LDSAPEDLKDFHALQAGVRPETRFWEVWPAVSPGPVILNGQNIVTNPISGTRQFYRLSQVREATTRALFK